MSNGNYYGPPPWGYPPQPRPSLKDQITEAEEGLQAYQKYVKSLKEGDDKKKDSEKKGFFGKIPERDLRWALFFFSPLTGLLMLKGIVFLAGQWSTTLLQLAK